MRGRAATAAALALVLGSRSALAVRVFEMGPSDTAPPAQPSPPSSPPPSGSAPPDASAAPPASASSSSPGVPEQIATFLVTGPGATPDLHTAPRPPVVTPLAAGGNAGASRLPPGV